MEKSTWLIEAGFDLDNWRKSVVEHYHFKGTPQQLEKHILKRYEEKAEYVTAELYCDHTKEGSKRYNIES